MEVFIVRPFGTKQVIKNNANGNGKPEVMSFNFDLVEEQLIMPALRQLNLDGGTTGRIFESGEIREDMFSLLLLADVVVADISIHNANVFYELGIRHALKNKTTVLLKCPGFDETPFDILGYRYVTYDKENPAAALPLLITSLQESRLSERNDSPVFAAMPQLDVQDTEKFFMVPAGFLEETEIATRAREPGKLSLLAEEASSFAWKIPAHRTIGEALVNMEAYDYARGVWEKLKERLPQDKQANMNLATIYQRLSEQELLSNPLDAKLLLAKSDICIEVLFNNDALQGEDLSAIYALKGRNIKSRWVNDVKKSLPEKMTQTALQSAYLEAAYLQYEKGYFENLNHFHCGINALGFLSILLALATKHPEAWALTFETEKDALEKIANLQDKQRQLVVCIRLAINIAKEKMSDEEQSASWLKITEADLVCLTSTNTERVRSVYRRALQSANQLQVETALRQIRMFELLQIMPENVEAALSAFPTLQLNPLEKKHYLLFTGHMIDAAERTTPRFPAGKEIAIKTKIKEAIQQEIITAGSPVTGIAGGACGGDILFHEVCAELGIPSKLFLAIPREQFIKNSVAFAGPGWVSRLDSLIRKLPVFVLADSEILPGWLRKKPGYDIWKRNNLWQLHAALSNGGLHITLLALWDGKSGDGPGGTEHLVSEARQKGARTVKLDINQITVS